MMKSCQTNFTRISARARVAWEGCELLHLLRQALVDP